MSAHRDERGARTPRARGISRRRWLATALGIAAAGAHAQGGTPAAPRALPERATAAIDALLAGRTAREGRVSLEIPRLAENGLSVPLTVSVQSPMTAVDHVRTVHIVAPVNPIPTVARLHFTPRSGEAFLSTRIRLADTQHVLAFAEMSDGSVWSGSAHVVVTLGGCLDPIL